MARNFLQVECDECGNRQKMFSRPSSEVECLVCGERIARPTGGKAEIEAEVVEELAVE